MAMRFGDRLRQLRHTKRVTQDRLAEMVNISASAVRAFEQGQRCPSWKAVVRLARALGTTSAEFDDCAEAVKKEPLRVPGGRPKKKARERWWAAKT